MTNTSSKVGSFLKNHIVGILLVSIGAGVAGNYVYGWLQKPEDFWPKVENLVSTFSSRGGSITNPGGGGGSITNPGGPTGGTNPGGPTGATNPPQTPDEYINRLKALDDRFLERQEYVKQNMGAVVEWEGVVSSVSQKDESNPISISLHSRGGGFHFLASMPKTHRTKAFSLQKGDVVRVKGTLDLQITSFPLIETSELTVVALRGKK
jgi:hypothetical protein